MVSQEFSDSALTVQSILPLSEEEEFALRRNLPLIRAALKKRVSEADRLVDEEKQYKLAKLHYAKILEIADPCISVMRNSSCLLGEYVGVVEEFINAANHLAKTNHLLAGNCISNSDAVEFYNQQSAMVLGKAWEWAEEFGLRRQQWQNLGDIILEGTQEDLEEPDPHKAIKRLSNHALSNSSLISAAEHRLDDPTEKEREFLNDQLVLYCNNGGVIQTHIAEMLIKQGNSIVNMPKKAEYYAIAIGRLQQAERLFNRASDILAKNPNMNSHKLKYTAVQSNLAYTSLVAMDACCLNPKPTFPLLTEHLSKFYARFICTLDVLNDPKNTKIREFFNNETHTRIAYGLLVMAQIIKTTNDRKLNLPTDYWKYSQQTINDIFLKYSPNINALPSIQPPEDLIALADRFLVNISNNEKDKQDQNFYEQVQIMMMRLCLTPKRLSV